MLKHIVMLKFKDRSTWIKTSEELSRQLNSLPGQIEGLLTMETGINLSTRPAAYDMVLTATLSDENQLECYRSHPAHVQVLDYLKPRLENSTVVDYLID